MPIFTADKTYVDALFQRYHSFGALAELWKQRCDSGHGSGIRSGAVVQVATGASETSADVGLCHVRRVVENALPQRSQLFPGLCGGSWRRIGRRLAIASAGI